MDAQLIELGAWPYLAVFAASAILSLVLSRVAEFIDHVDRPDQRKQHGDAVPLAGGVAVFTAFFTAVFFFGLTAGTLLELFLLATFILTVGFLDDRVGLSPRIRLATQVLVGIAFVLACDFRLENLGDLAGTGAVELAPLAAVVFTVFCVVCVINAVNMMDGADGLAGSVGIVVLINIGVVAFASGMFSHVESIGLLTGALLGFVVLFNFPSGLRLRRIFLGDAGSMFLGFAIAWLAIMVASGSSASVYPITMVWILGMLIIDTVATVIRRLARNSSPLSPGRDHLHHLLMDSGLSVRQTVLTIALAQVVTGSVGIAGWLLGASEALLALSFVVLGFSYLGVTQLAWARLASPGPGVIETRRKTDLHVNLLIDVGLLNNIKVAGEADDDICQGEPGSPGADSPGGTPARSSGSISEQREIG